MYNSSNGILLPRMTRQNQKYACMLWHNGFKQLQRKTVQLRLDITSIPLSRAAQGAPVRMKMNSLRLSQAAWFE